MNEKPWEETSIYRNGLRALEWGKLLMNPDTTMREIADFGDKWNITPRMVLVAPPDDTVPMKTDEATP